VCLYTFLLFLKKSNFSHSSFVFPKEELFKLELALDQPFIFLFVSLLVGSLVRWFADLSEGWNKFCHSRLNVPWCLQDFQENTTKTATLSMGIRRLSCQLSSCCLVNSYDVYSRQLNSASSGIYKLQCPRKWRNAILVRQYNTESQNHAGVVLDLQTASVVPRVITNKMNAKL